MRNDPELNEPDPLPRVVSRRDALGRGLSRHAIDRRVASQRWRLVLPRTYLTADTFTDHDRLVAALAFAGDGAALSGAGALIASGVKRIRFPARVLVLVPQANCVKSTQWVHVRRTERPIVTELWSGPRRVEVARAAFDLAVTMRALDDVRTLVARVVQDRHCTIAELRAEHEVGQRRGSKHFREALDEVDDGAASAPEARAARILARAGLIGFMQNATITLPTGATRVVDFYWPRLRACLEIDSVEWHFDHSEWSGTWDRHLDLAKFGYSVIHRSRPDPRPGLMISGAHREPALDSRPGNGQHQNQQRAE